jgi:Competence protein CoiA-like family
VRLSSEVPVMVDLLVVGLDLETGQEVHASSRPAWEWRLKGHNGNQTLVCLDCYIGADLPGGPQPVALVPKGRLGGACRTHFAHPPGMAPPGGHGRETIWHAQGKQRMRRWALARGAAARVEAYTADRRRRSDVAVTLQAGQRVAIEVQLGAISDADWLARHHDYAMAGITDVWLGHSSTWVPRVAFVAGQPGWILDLDHDRLGLLYARPATPAGLRQPDGPGCGQVHWPPCCGDPLGTQWMPLETAQLTPDGIQPSAHAAADLARQATAIRAITDQAARAAAEKAPPQSRTAMARDREPAGPPPAPGPAELELSAGQLRQPHRAIRYDARPPGSDPDTWWYRCDQCGRSGITGAELDAGPIIHMVPTLESRTHGLPLVRDVPHGGASSAGPTVRTLPAGSTEPASTSSWTSMAGESG